MFNPNGKSRFTSRLLSSMALTAALTGAQVQADVLNPSIGNLLWEENFNSLDSTTWNTINGDGCEIGLCGWGNQELEYYSGNNLSIEQVPFEPATTALAITAKRETLNGHEFTSGKITSDGKVQIKYGMIEIRMSTPQVGTGLWPAAWMLGTSLASWPAKGELDIMEMGHSAAGRAGAGFPSADINSYVGSNAIFYASAACVEGNPTCAASTAWQTANAYVAAAPLVNRFVKYRMYWTDTQIRFTVIDNGVEHDMYQNPIPINEESSEFQASFYLLFNLAVGGNFTDAASPGQVTAPLPGKMYIDYVRVYQLDGQGEVKLGSQVQPEAGTFGVFTDNTPSSNKEQLGVTADLWIWNTNSVEGGNLPAYEGSNVIAWNYKSANEWFGGGIAGRQARDMSKFVNGQVKFRIKIPANVAFKVGVMDTYTNQNWITFPANETKYGLVRNGDWGQVTIPVDDMRGPLIALQSMSSLFNIASADGALPTGAFQMAVDDVIWECGDSADCQASSSSSSSVVSSASSSVSSSSVISSSSSTSSQTSSASSSSVASGNSYSINGNSVTFTVNNASWADIHFTVNNGGQMNVRMTHNADMSNTYVLSDLPAGALIGYSFTIGQAAGAYDTSWAQFTLPAVSSSSASSSSSSSSSSVASSAASSAQSYGFTKLSATSVQFYANNAPWVDIHYTLNNGGQLNVRMLHNGDNSNTYTLTDLPQGTLVNYSFTIGQAVGAMDTPWQAFNQ